MGGVSKHEYFSCHNFSKQFCKAKSYQKLLLLSLLNKYLYFPGRFFPKSFSVGWQSKRISEFNRDFIFFRIYGFIYWCLFTWYVFNNYLLKAKWTLVNVHQDEVEVNIYQCSRSLKRIIVLVSFSEMNIKDYKITD